MIVIPNQVRTSPIAILDLSPPQAYSISFFIHHIQSSLPLAWKSFTPAGRLMPSSNRDRLVDVCEELVKFTCLLYSHKALLDDRYSEREEKRVKGRLLTQAEKEKAKDLPVKEELVIKMDALHTAHDGKS